jgi:hypothetical protein
LGIDLIIVKLGFDDFWGFSIDWLRDFYCDGVFLDVDFPVLCSCSNRLCVGSGYGFSKLADLGKSLLFSVGTVSGMV